MVISKALELYERLSLGQIEYVGEVIHELHSKNLINNVPMYTLADNFKCFKHMIGLSRDQHLGMGSDKQSEDGKIAYDIHCVLRNKIAKSLNHHPYSVWHRPPLHYSTLPLPTIKETEL